MSEKTTLQELDQAVANRLAKLSAVPQDTSRLDARLRSIIESSVVSQHKPHRLFMAWRPSIAAAAAILIVVTLGIFLATHGNTTAMAAPSRLAQLHAHAIGADSMTTSVSSIEEANRVLMGQWSDLPGIPNVDAAKLHACCIHDFMDDRVVCLVLRDGQEPLTMVVGHARSFRPAKGRVADVGGRRFQVHNVDGLLMAMIQLDNRFVCLMGEVTEDRLLQIAGELKF